MDGAHAGYDAVVAATGYRTGLERLLPQPGLVDPHGYPYVHGGRPAAPGLYFLGFSVTLGGALRDLSKEARRVARSLQRTGSTDWRTDERPPTHPTSASPAPGHHPRGRTTADLPRPAQPQAPTDRSSP